MKKWITYYEDRPIATTPGWKIKIDDLAGTPVAFLPALTPLGYRRQGKRARLIVRLVNRHLAQQAERKGVQI